MISLHLIVLIYVSLIDCCIGIVCLVDPHYPRFCCLSSLLMSVASSIDDCILLIIEYYSPLFFLFCTTSASSIASLTASLAIWKQHTGSSSIGFGNSPLSFWITSDASWSGAGITNTPSRHHRDQSSIIWSPALRTRCDLRHPHLLSAILLPALPTSTTSTEYPQWTVKLDNGMSPTVNPYATILPYANARCDKINRFDYYVNQAQVSTSAGFSGSRVISHTSQGFWGNDKSRLYPDST